MGRVHGGVFPLVSFQLSCDQNPFLKSASVLKRTHLLRNRTQYTLLVIAKIARDNSLAHHGEPTARRRS